MKKTKKLKRSKRSKKTIKKNNKYSKLNKLVSKLNKELSKIPKKKHNDIYNNLLRTNRIRSGSSVGINIREEITWGEVIKRIGKNSTREKTAFSTILGLVFDNKKYIETKKNEASIYI